MNNFHVAFVRVRIWEPFLAADTHRGGRMVLFHVQCAFYHPVKFDKTQHARLILSFWYETWLIQILIGSVAMVLVPVLMVRAAPDEPDVALLALLRLAVGDAHVSIVILLHMEGLATPLTPEATGGLLKPVRLVGSWLHPVIGTQMGFVEREGVEHLWADFALNAARMAQVDMAVPFRFAAVGGRAKITAIGEVMGCFLSLHQLFVIFVVSIDVYGQHTHIRGLHRAVWTLHGRHMFQIPGRIGSQSMSRQHQTLLKGRKGQLMHTSKMECQLSLGLKVFDLVVGAEGTDVLGHLHPCG